MKKLLLTKGRYGNSLSVISPDDVKRRLKNGTLIELKNGIYEGTVIEDKPEKSGKVKEQKAQKTQTQSKDAKPSRAKKNNAAK